MGQVQQHTINWLMISVAVIIFFIFLPFILKAFKGKKKEESGLLGEVRREKLKSLDKSEKEKQLAGHPQKTKGNFDEDATVAASPINDESTASGFNVDYDKTQLMPSSETSEEKKSLENALLKTKENLFGRIKGLFKSEEISALDEIEEILYTSDIGPQTVSSLMAKLDDDLSRSQKKNLEAIKDSLKKEILNIFNQVPENQKLANSKEGQDLLSRIQWSQQGPTVVMIVGVNGAGKTTTIGKLSSYFASQNKRVLVAAGDTFRAAAQSQLKVWTDRAQVEVFAPERVQDPSAVAYDAVAKAKAQNYDLVIIDTAGRLHTQTNLMEELKKVKRVIQKNIPEAPHEVIIVLDANSGQNALIQAKEFNAALGLTGVILTKMDGTAKGGVAIGITNELKVPIKLIGIGEKISDLKPFSSREYIDSIFG